MNQKSSSKEEWKTARPQEHIYYLHYYLNKTPKWRIFERLRLKRIIKFWESQFPINNI